MEQKTLKYLRVFIPGIIILLGIYPIYNKYLSDIISLTSLETTYLIFISIILGGVYFQLNIQHVITWPSHWFIVRNIYNKIVEAYGSDITDEMKKKLKEKDNYKTIFYKIIDGDESLKRRGENVRFNGIFWTSTADITVINLIFYFLYKFFLQGIPKVEILSKYFLYSALIGFVFHIISVIKHIYLSNQQLIPITMFKDHTEKVKELVNDLI